MLAPRDQFCTKESARKTCKQQLLCVLLLLCSVQCAAATSCVCISGSIHASVCKIQQRPLEEQMQSDDQEQARKDMRIESKTHMHESVRELQGATNSCQQILTTPLPLSYTRREASALSTLEQQPHISSFDPPNMARSYRLIAQQTLWLQVHLCAVYVVSSWLAAG